MNSKTLIAVVVIAAVAVIGFQLYRQNELENRLLQQQQAAQSQAQQFQSELAAKEKENDTLRQAQQQVLDGIEAKNKAKADLQNRPFLFIKGGNFDVFRRGIFSISSRATALELTNSSEFDVSDVGGSLTYMTAAGAEIATVPFTADGDVGAGQTKKLTINATEVTGDARQGRIAVNRVRIIGGAN